MRRQNAYGRGNRCRDGKNPAFDRKRNRRKIEINTPEILAPVGNFEMLKAAVAAGADAVYLGLNRFNARSKADNFADEFFVDALCYCRLRGIKVYVTFNIIIKESEFDEAKRSVDFIIKSGADGIIVQDLGILRYVAEKYPDFPVHVSTQAGICNLEGVKYMKKLGAKRVVLARETSLAEVKRITSSIDIEIEYFVQGALCVCYSGNCYMSSIIDGNSGNRGRCAQVCRKKACLCVDGKEIFGYNLSPCDTCLIGRVDELKKAGITSFKIEGRMRSPEYVYYAVKAYKHAILGQKVPNDLLFNLKASFNRGEYSTAYIDGRKSKVIYNKANGNIGAIVGKVVRANSNCATVESSYKPTVGDGFKAMRLGLEVGGGRFLKGDKYSEKGFTVSIKNLRVGDEIRLNYSEKSNSFAKSFENKVKIAIKYNVFSDKIDIEATLKDFYFAHSYPVSSSEAKSIPLTSEAFEAQFTKSGRSDFSIESISGNIEGNLFFQKSVINEIRRDFLDRLLKAYVKNSSKTYSISSEKPPKERKSYPIQSAVIFNEKLLDENFVCDALVLRPTDYSFLAKKLVDAEKLFLYVPCFLDKNDVALLDEIFAANSFSGIYADGLSAVSYAEERGISYIVGVSCNITNKKALEAFDNAIGFVNSKELNSHELIEGGMVLSRGHFANMTFAHCPLINANISSCSSCSFKSVSYKDEEGRVFPLFKNKISGCLFTLLNNKEIYIDNVQNYLYDYSYFLPETIKKPPEGSFNKGHFCKGIK